MKSSAHIRPNIKTNLSAGSDNRLDSSKRRVDSTKEIHGPVGP